MISTALEHLATELAAATGLRVTLDLDDLNPPSLHITLERLETWTFGHGAELHATIWAVVPATDESSAYRALDALLPTTQAAMESLQLPQTGAIDAVTIAPSVPGEPLPALKIPTSIHTAPPQE